MSKNAWWEFVKAHKKEVEHIVDRKERFQALSQMWKNQKANMIYVDINYLSEIHATNSRLKASLDKALLENDQLKGMICILQSQCNDI